MANLYGVANAPGLPVILGGANFPGVACAPNVYTQIGTTPTMVAPSAGYFYAFIMLTLEISFGAALPSTLFFACSIGAGSATNASGIGQFGLLVNAANIITAPTYTPVSQVAWQGAGSTIGLWLQPGGVTCTVQNTSTGIVTLFRAPDQ